MINPNLRIITVLLENKFHVNVKFIFVSLYSVRKPTK